MARTPTVRTVAVLALTGLLLTACGASDDGAAESIAGTDADGSTDPSSGAAADVTPEVAAPSAIATVHLVRSGPVAFFVEPVPAPVPADAPPGDAPADRVARAIAALLAISDPDDPDLATSVPPGTAVRDVVIEGDVVVLDLGGALSGSSGGSAEEVTLAEQLAHTVLAAASGTTGVRVLVDGAPVESLWGHLDWSVPLVADPFALSPVTIEVPAHGATVPAGAISVSGQATVFEATVLVRLERADGTVLEEGFVTATAGGPGRGTWTWTVTLPEPGAYRLIAGASDPSDGEGPPPFEVARSVTAG